MDIQIDTQVQYLLNSGWVLVAAGFVFLMQAGFACCESGYAQAKNANNIWLKNLMDFAVGAAVYYFIGFGLMYGDDWNGLIGINGFIDPLNANLQIWTDLKDKLNPSAFLLFQTMFCATTATIISGAVAERFKFNSYLIVSAVMTGIIYPITGHWVWGGGWLSTLGFVDFAGSIAVHSVGGFAALACAAMVGARKGKYSADGTVNKIPCHNIPMGLLGTFILWFGWYGFNPGSELALDDVTFYTAVTTTLAAAGGALGAIVISWIMDKKPDPTMAGNGALGGLVGICSGVAEVSFLGSFAVGAILGVVVVLSLKFIETKLKVDDVVGAISIHGVCGMGGALCTGFFSTKLGAFYGNGFEQLGYQVIGILACCTFAFVVAMIMCVILKATAGIRVEAKEEVEGLDIDEHLMPAYPEFMDVK